MPHMSNLSWLPLYSFFSFTFLFMLSMTQINKISYPKKTSNMNNKMKKWVW